MLLTGYVASQQKRISIDSALYNGLNAVGSGLLAWIAIVDRRWGFILLETLWALFAIPPLVRAFSARGR